MPQATRVEAGRGRARAAKRAVTLTAAAGFVVLLAVARQGHPAAGTSTTPTSTTSVSHSTGSSSSLKSGSSLGGGYISPSSGGSPPVASQTS